MKDEKYCFKCKETKSVSDFYRNKTRKDGYHGNCKSCQRDYCWANSILKKFGMTAEEYNLIYAEQEGNCKLCGIHQKDVNRRFDVDYDAETGQVRGLLCRKCNLGLVFLLGILEQARDYLK